MSNNPDNSAQKMSDSQAAMWALMALAVVLGFIFKNHLPKVERFYFNYFEEAYLSLFGVVALVVGAILYWFIKRTSDMRKRAELLCPYWKKYDDSIEVGKTHDGIKLHLDDKQRTSHVQVIGTTGRGKTQSVVVPWAIRDLERGKSVILIDGKGSKDVIRSIYSYRNQLEEKTRNDDIIKSVEVLEFDLENYDSITLNPLRNGSPQQITDRIFSSFEFDDPYYKSVQYDICGYLTKLLLETGETITFKSLYDLLTDDSILAKKVQKLSKEERLRKVLTAHLKESANERKKRNFGLISQLSPFAVGELSEFVNGGAKEVSLEKLLCEKKASVDDPKILLVSIPTLKYQTIGHQLGKLILQDLAYSVGKREDSAHKEFMSVFLDEFSEFVYEGFVSLLNKARSANIGLHLCHQALSDLTNVSESFAKSINTNTNVKCLLGLNDPETADFYARHLGTRTTEKFTTQMQEKGFLKEFKETGMASLRDVEAYKVHPNELKEFYQGEGVLHFPTAKGVITEVISYKPYSIQGGVL